MTTELATWLADEARVMANFKAKAGYGIAD